MVPSMAPQPANAPADSASIAGAAGPGAQQAADPGAAASDGGASAFHDALADACGDAARSQPDAKGAAKRKGAACDGAAVPAPTFPAWRLVIALDARRVGDAKSGKGHQKPKADAEAEGDASSDGAAAAVATDAAAPQGIVVVPDVPVVPAFENTLPATGATGDAVQGGAASSGEAATALNAAEATGPGPSAIANENAKDTAPSEAGQKISGESAAPPNVTAQRSTLQAGGDAGQPVATSAASSAPTTSSQPPASVDVPTTESNRSNQPSSGKPAAAQGAPPASGAPVASANPQAPPQASAAASTPAAATNDTDGAPATLAAAVSASTPAPAEKTDARQSKQDRMTETASPGTPIESAAAASAMGHSGGNRDATPQHGEPEARGHNASPEPLMTSRAVAFASAMTLVSSPDGTLRIASLLSAPQPLASLMPEESRANLDSMVQAMRVMVRDTVSEATVHLRPEHFGDVTIQVRVDGKSVSAIVSTESPGVREWLQGQESTIRNGLSEHGLQLDRLVVQRDGRHDRRQPAPQPQGPKRRRARDDADAQQTFEVSV